MSSKPYADSRVWDKRFRAILPAGDPDRSNQWLDPFLPLLAKKECRRVLDLGCGSGHDAVALARRGFAVSAIDHSPLAVAAAERLAAGAGAAVSFRQGDIGLPLPYQSAAFDAVLSNLLLHAFDGSVLRSIIAEVRRCLRPSGLFLFHVNSTEDVPLRLARQPAERQLGPCSYVLAGGQTMHFFSRSDCDVLLAGWSMLDLEAVTSFSADGLALKHAWRCAAQDKREISVGSF